MKKQIPACIHASLWAVIICCLPVACNKGSLNEYSGSYKPREEGPTGNISDIIYIQTIILKKDRTPLLPIVFKKMANRYLWKKGRFIPVDREYPPVRMRVPLIQTRK